MINEKKLLTIRLCLGISLLVLLVSRVGLTDIYLAFSNARLFYLFLGLLIFLAAQCLGALNLIILVKPLQTSISIARLCRIYFLSWSYGLIFPGKLGEFSTVVFLKTNGFEFGEALFVTLLDKIISMLVLLPIAFCGVALLFKSQLYFNSLIFFAVGFLFLLIFGFSSFGRTIIKRYLLKKYAAYFSGFSNTTHYYVSNCKKQIFANFLLTTAKLALHYLVAVIFFRAFNLAVPFYVVAAVCSLALIIAMVPISISGLGVFQSAVVVLYGFFGISADITLSIELINLVFMYFLAALLIMTLRVTPHAVISKENPVAAFVFPFMSGPFGAERLLSDIIKSVKSSYQVKLYTLFVDSGARELVPEDAQLTATLPRFARFPHTIRTFISPFLVGLLLSRKVDPKSDIIHLMNWQSLLAAGALRRKCKNARIIYHCTEPPRFIHDLRDETLEGVNFFTRGVLKLYMNIISAWEMHSLRSVHKIIAISDWSASQVSTLYGLKSEIIYPGIQLERFSRLDTDSAREQLQINPEFKVYVTVSKLHRRKKLEASIELFRKSAPERSAYFIIGSGPEEKSLKNYLASTGDKRITLLGQLSDSKVAVYLAAADCFIFTAKNEPFGIAALEAKASGCEVLGVQVNYPITSCEEAGRKILQVYEA